MHLAADYRRTHVEIDTQDCDLPQDEQTRIQQDLDLLAQELLEFPDSQLFLKIVHHPRTERYHAQAKLKLPGKTIITGRYSPWLHEALTHCLDRVRQRAEQYKESPDRDAIREAEEAQQITSAESVAAPTEPDVGELGRAVAEGDYRRFRLAMANYEREVRSQVAHWTMRYPRFNELIGEEFDADDVVEEVFLMAFDDYAERPDEKTISQWLTEFVDPAVHALWADPLERENASYARTLGAPDKQ
jgi:ribosome-associated translation inhibitor RaiA